MKIKCETLLLIACLVILFNAGVSIYQQKVINKYKALLEQVDTIVKHDTLYQTLIFNDTITKVKEKKVIKTDTVFTPKGDTLKIDLKKKEYSNTLIQEQDTLQYHAFVTGRSFEDEDYPSLDSININYNKQVINTTTIIEKPIEHKKKLKFILTPTITSGYDPINKQWGAMVGIGIGLTKK